MLGRTDSRRRLLFLLVVFVVGSLAAARAARVLAGRPAATTSTARPSPRPRSASRSPSRRGDIYDRSGTVVLATTVDRDRLVAAADQLHAPSSGARTGDELDPAPRARRGAAATLRDRLASGKAVRRPRPRHRAGASPSGSAQAAARRAASPASRSRPEPERVYPQDGGGPDSTLAAHLLGFVNREGAGQYGVEQSYQDDARRRARGSCSRSATSTAGRCPDTLVVEDAGRDRRGRPPDHRRRPPARARAGAAGGLDRRRGQERVGRRDGPVHRRDLRRGDLPLVRRQRLPADRGRRRPSRFIDPIVSNVYEPGSVFKMMTAIDRPRDRARSRRTTRIKDVGDAPARQAAGPRSTTPTTRAWAG